MGITAAGRRGDCSSQLGNEVQSVLEKAKAAGKSVGFVTTTYVNHASPSGVFGKTAERTWYSDKRMANDPNVDDEGQDYLYYGEKGKTKRPRPNLTFTSVRV